MPERSGHRGRRIGELRSPPKEIGERRVTAVTAGRESVTTA